MTWWKTAALACITWCACDSTVDERRATTGSGGSIGGEAGDATGGGGAGGAPGDCDSVPQYIANLLAAATECNALDPGPHCQDVVDGFCCPVVVESINSPATQAYLDFLELTQTECPELWMECSLVDCALPSGGVCTLDAGGTAAHCEPEL